MQLSYLEKAVSRQNPYDVWEEAGDQSMHFQNEQVLSDIEKAMSWQNPDDIGGGEAGDQSLHFQKDQVLSELEKAMYRQNHDDIGGGRGGELAISPCTSRRTNVCQIKRKQSPNRIHVGKVAGDHSMHSQNNQLLSQKAMSRQNADDIEEEACCVEEELQHPSTVIKLSYDIMRIA